MPSFLTSLNGQSEEIAHDYAEATRHAYPADRVVGRMGGCAPADAREGKGSHAGQGRARRRTPAMTPAQADDIHAYVIDRAWAAYKSQHRAGGGAR